MLKLPLKLIDFSSFIDKPYIVYEQENIFDVNDYEELLASYPNREKYQDFQHSKGNKATFKSSSPRFPEFLKEAPLWNALYDQMNSQEFVSKWHKLYSPFLSHRKWSDKGAWELTNIDKGNISRMSAVFKRWFSIIVKRRVLVRFQFEFSYIGDGGFIPPHTDLTSKFLSLLIFFPDATWKDSAVGGTEFYKEKLNQSMKKEWDSKLMGKKDSMRFFETHELAFRSEFTANKLIGFVKSDNTWHGISALNLPSGVHRKALVINIFRW